MSPIPVIAFVGRSKSGKTTLLEKLIRELGRRGYRVAAVKHTAHPIEPDAPGKDTYRFAQAGAVQVILAAPEMTLEEALAGVQDVDLALVEGYKRADVPKIEVHWSGGAGKQGGGEELVCAEDERFIAIVSDRRFDVDVPQFDVHDVVRLADWIERRFLRRITG
jgi:molybdopterin-guanine dinucleotide biosynthesis protein MobB